MTGKLLALVAALSLFAALAILLALLFPFSLHWAVVALVNIVVAVVLLVRSVGLIGNRTQSPLLRSAVTVLLWGLIGIGFYLVYPGLSIYYLASALGGAIGSLLALSLHAWCSFGLTRDSKVYRIFNSGLGTGIPVIVLLLVTWLLLLSPLNDFFRNRPGQAASWTAQFSLAQREANQVIEEDAALASIRSSPVNPLNSNFETSLESYFFFESPSGKGATVVFNEIAPDLTDRVYKDEAQPFVQSETDFVVLRKSVSVVKISASEALARMKPEALALERERGVQLRPMSVELSLRGRSATTDIAIPDGLSAVWEVTIWGLNPYVVQVKYWVNAETGEIVKRDYGELGASR